VVAGYETKDAKSFRDELRKRPSARTELSRVSEQRRGNRGKTADGAKIQRWFECRNCGYEASSRIVYGAER